MVTEPVNTQRASFLVDQLNLISQPSEHCLGSKSSTVGEFCLWASPSPTTTTIRIHLCPMEPIPPTHPHSAHNQVCDMGLANQTIP